MNWGNKLLVTFIVFGAGMSFLVYSAVKTNFELVEKEYYKTELRYQQHIDSRNRYNQLDQKVSVDQSAEGLRIQFPNDLDTAALEGQLWFYCAYDATRDKKIKLDLDEKSIQFIPAGLIRKGNYTVKINWTSNKQNYYTEKPISVL